MELIIHLKKKKERRTHHEQVRIYKTCEALPPNCFNYQMRETETETDTERDYK
jgi:hypothetical protein